MKAQYLGRTFEELVDKAFKVFDVENRGHITLKGRNAIHNGPTRTHAMTRS